MAIRKNRAIMDLINGMQMRFGYIGYADVDESWRTGLLATPFNRLYLIDSGSGVLKWEQGEEELKPGNAYLLPAGLPCSYYCNGALSLLFFHFNIPKPDRFDLMQEADRPASIRFSKEKISELKKLCAQSGYEEAFEVTCAVNDIVLEMKRKYRFRWNAPASYSADVAGTIFAINRNLSASLRVDELAARCFISRSYLSRLFRKEVGVTIKQYINMQLINAAQWRLGNTNDSVEKISSDLGFCSQFYFSEFFKKRCRVSPLQYRHGTKY